MNKVYVIIFAVGITLLTSASAKAGGFTDQHPALIGAEVGAAVGCVVAGGVMVKVGGVGAKDAAVSCGIGAAAVGMVGAAYGGAYSAAEAALYPSAQEMEAETETEE